MVCAEQHRGTLEEEDMINAKIDSNGYPTEAALRTIKIWQPAPDEGWGALQEERLR